MPTRLGCIAKPMLISRRIARSTRWKMSAMRASHDNTSA